MDGQSDSLGYCCQWIALEGERERERIRRVTSSLSLSRLAGDSGDCERMTHCAVDGGALLSVVEAESCQKEKNWRAAPRECCSPLPFRTCRAGLGCLLRCCLAKVNAEC